VQILETNLDDVPGEVLGYMIDKIIASGARDVTISPAITKKGRPTHLVSVICDSDTVNSILDTLVSETGTLGVRIRSSARYIVPRTMITIPITIHGKNFSVKCKLINKDGTTRHFKVEADDVKMIADSVSLSFKDANDIIREQVKNKINVK
jgi:uncharacterized protein (DUF111 family)